MEPDQDRAKTAREPHLWQSGMRQAEGLRRVYSSSGILLDRRSRPHLLHNQPGASLAAPVHGEIAAAAVLSVFGASRHERFPKSARVISQIAGDLHVLRCEDEIAVESRGDVVKELAYGRL